MRNEKWSEWKRWEGGDNPLSPMDFVEIKSRNGLVEDGESQCFYWPHDDAEYDIIAYRYKIKEPESDMHPDLEWLARNVSEWPIDHEPDCGPYTHAFVSNGKARFGYGHYGHYWHSKSEWLQARKDLGLENWNTSLTDTPEEAAALEDMVKASSAEVCNYPNCTCPIDKTTVCARGLPDAMTVEEEELPAREHQYSPYFKDVRHIDTLDVYRVIDLFGCEKHGHPISHAVKKLLLSGVRTGGKDVEKDVSEAIDSLLRWKEMREEDGNKN